VRWRREEERREKRNHRLLRLLGKRNKTLQNLWNLWLILVHCGLRLKSKDRDKDVLDRIYGMDRLTWWGTGSYARLLVPPGRLNKGLVLGVMAIDKGMIPGALRFETR
jgi:hypothetical protein